MNLWAQNRASHTMRAFFHWVVKLVNWKNFQCENYGLQLCFRETKQILCVHRCEEEKWKVGESYQKKMIHQAVTSDYPDYVKSFRWRLLFPSRGTQREEECDHLIQSCLYCLQLQCFLALRKCHDENWSHVARELQRLTTLNCGRRSETC